MNWVDVKDGYPDEDGMLVVVFDPSDHPNVWSAKWDAGNRSFDCIGGWFEQDEVTHWMPLPPPPKSKEWKQGFDAATKDEKASKEWYERSQSPYYDASKDPYFLNDFTHNPYQPTSPWTYPDAYAGPPTREAVEWEAGYKFRMDEYTKIKIVVQVTIDDLNGGKIVTYM